ncbi:MAG: class I SAM-dependent methyltransferase [Gammaproteobacteria bacterium]
MDADATGPPDQPTYWNEEGGRRWVQNIQRAERMLEPLSERLLRHAGAQTGERVLDVGCGGGITSAALAGAVGPSGRVVGLDVSAVILDVARERYGNVGNLSFVLGDAAVAPLDAGAFDLVASRFGVMFFADPVAAFTNLRGALAPGGRLAFICWRALDLNPWMADCVRAIFSVLPPPEPLPKDAPGPFAFADADRLRDLLTRGGFGSISIDPLDEPLDLGSVDEGVTQMTRMGPAASAFAAASAADQAAALAAVRAALKRHETSGAVRMASATWLVGARR